jgi:hypothetical protein
MNCNKYNRGNIGKLFSFVIDKEAVIPDGFAVFIIKDYDNCKFTIPKNYYSQYNFKAGNKIICKLDKINCSGQIFFEPQNPYYKEGNIYKFDFIELKTIKNYLEFDEQVCIIKDIFGQTQQIRNASKITIKNNKVKAIVAFIKKGKPFLIPESSFKNILKPEKIFLFTIIGKTGVERFGEVYIIIDKSGNKHILPVDYYKNYNLEKEKRFFGIVKRFSSKGFFYIEPLHPKYKIGEKYFFIINKILTSKILVEDCFKNIIQLPKTQSIIKNNTILCKVVDLKKGKPVIIIA